MGVSNCLTKVKDKEAWTLKVNRRLKKRGNSEENCDLRLDLAGQ